MRPGTGAALLLAIGNVASPAVAQPARTINLSPNDYPAGAVPGPEAREVRVRYQLADDGSFASCEIARSSGEPLLDDAGCRLLRERARFRPERGHRRGTLILRWLSASGGRLNPPGAPIPVSLHDEVWSSDYPSEAIRRNASGTVTYAVHVSQSGVPQRCEVIEPSGSAALDSRTCQIVMERSAFIPAANGRGGRAAGVYRSRITWRMAD